MSGMRVMAGAPNVHPNAEMLGAGAAWDAAGLDSPVQPFEGHRSSILQLAEDTGLQGQELERLQELRQNLLERQTVYGYCASYYAWRYYFFTIPSIVITTSISILSAVWPYEDDTKLATAGRVVISVLAALGTVITAMLSLFKYQSKMDSFYGASQQMDGMVTRLSFLTKYRMGERISRQEVELMITGIQEKLHEIRQNAPPIPTQLWLEGLKEEDAMIEMRRSRSVVRRRDGWQAAQVHPDPGATVNSRPQTGADAPPAETEVVQNQWC